MFSHRAQVRNTLKCIAVDSRSLKKIYLHAERLADIHTARYPVMKRTDRNILNENPSK